MARHFFLIFFFPAPPGGWRRLSVGCTYSYSRSCPPGNQQVGSVRLTLRQLPDMLRLLQLSQPLLQQLVDPLLNKDFPDSILHLR